LSMQFHFKLKNACKNQQWSLKFQFFFSSIQKKITLLQGASPLRSEVPCSINCLTHWYWY
jgi:hypothetical protein